jgi:acetyltransferase-like isoleucine patch superfamily enzyme
MIKKILYLIDAIYLGFVLILPNTAMFNRWRANYYRRQGCNIAQDASISPNVRIKGKFEMGSGSSFAYNCCISGESSGIFIGKNVMIAPNCVLVAFNHGFDRLDIPMVQQPNKEAPIYIDDDVWIAANCTIACGVKIGTGSIIAANSAVTKDIPPYSIAGGVPAKVIKSRLNSSVTTL